MPTQTAAPPMLDIIEALRTGDPGATRAALADLRPAFRDVYDQGETAWRDGAAADFLAATLYASPRYYLRLHAHAPGAVDTDLHTHKGTVYSTVLSGGLTNTAASPAFSDDRAGLDVWQCACLADGTHTQQRTGLTAVVDPATIVGHQLGVGDRFTVAPGDYHRLAISRDPAAPTVTLCLFEQVDPNAPDAYVLTNRPTPVLADRDMTVDAARTAVRLLLDAGIAG